MRLGQLSRKLEVESSTIVKVLKEHFREVNNHPNVKILDEELEFLTQKYSPKNSAPQPKTIVEEQSSELIAKESLEAPSLQKEVPVFVESLRPKVITLESEFDEKKKALESFKAEKPELEGLRVLGKIELPEPKPKTPKADKAEEKKEGTNTVNERTIRNRNNRRGQKTRVNRTPAEERKRAEQMAKRQKAAEERKLKELKRKHYEENVKAKIADKPKRKKKKKLVQKFEASANVHSQSDKAQKSTNPLVRFWKWLNGDYDKFR